MGSQNKASIIEARVRALPFKNSPEANATRDALLFFAKDGIDFQYVNTIFGLVVEEVHLDIIGFYTRDINPAEKCAIMQNPNGMVNYSIGEMELFDAEAFGFTIDDEYDIIDVVKCYELGDPYKYGEYLDRLVKLKEVRMPDFFGIMFVRRMFSPGYIEKPQPAEEESLTNGE